MRTLTFRSLRATSRYVLAGLILLAAAACGDDEEATNELQEAREQWQNAGPDAYRIDLTVTCQVCPPRPHTLTVENGTVTNVDPPIPEDSFVEAHPVPSLFDVADDALDTAEVVTVDYDEDYGYPVTISIDETENAIDDEVDYSVDNFEPVD